MEGSGYPEVFTVKLRNNKIEETLVRRHLLKAALRDRS